MLFRVKDSTIISIDRITFNTDREYYTYIKTQVVGGVIKNKCSIVDDLVPFIKNTLISRKNSYICR